MADNLGMEGPDTATGLLELMMIHETLSPLLGGYNATRSLRAMRLIRQVIINRCRHPAMFGARGTPPGPNAAYAVMRVRQAFLDFADAPDLKPKFMKHTSDILSFARQAGHVYHQRCLDHVKLAVQAATEVPPPEAVRHNLYYWLADWADPPKASSPVFLIENVQGNKFWGQNIRE